jgi:transglutaminase-like putative cysteine protease
MLAAVTERPGQAVVDKSRAFRDRARLEADRYGPDPWIFVRELLQNSRDAGANAVVFTVGERPAGEGSHEVVEWVACQDDGEGMTFEHARRYLFALYASSKEDRKNQAGKFGVGFWSILRFDPQAIIIRSRPREGAAWAVRLDGSLERAEHVEPPTRAGTEIVLERPRGDGRLEHRIYDAVWQSARYLHRRDAPEQALPITINGRSANAEFALGAPSASFRRSAVRGVVGLGRAPRVELFCRGLRVRAAACLEDLVAPAGRHTARIRVQFPELPAGLAPQALLESNALEVLLSRSDARDGRALARLVKLAQRELERLVERQLAFARPSPWYRRAFDQVRSRLRESLIWRTVAGSSVGAAAAIVLSLWLWGGPGSSAPAEPDAAAPLVVADPGEPRAANHTYEDLGRRYRGPRVDVLAAGAAEPIDLRYQPGGVRLHFAAFAAIRLRDDGEPDHEVEARIAGAYRGEKCQRDCTDVSVLVRESGAMRLPVPTGHRVVHESVAFEGRPLALHATEEGHAAVDLGVGGQGRVRYQTTLAADPEPAPKTHTVKHMPEWLARKAHDLRHLAVNERMAKLLSFVRDNVAYDRTEEMARLHAEAKARGQGFIDRTLALGKGDCDFQNGLLVGLLQAADVPARLAVGYLGVDGKALPWLHAWVEYRDEAGNWHIADASERTAPAVGTTAAGVGPTASEGPREGKGTARPPSQGGGAATPSSPSEPDDDGAAEPEASPPVVQVVVEDTVAVPAEVAAPLVTRDDDPIPPHWRVWLWPSLALTLLLGAVLTLMGGRTRRAFKLDHSADLSRLLQGVLQQPGAFGAMSALLYRPLVPLVSHGAISLQRARELAAKGRLYRTHRRPPLAMRASRAGTAVLDTCSPEGQTVADALGAVDLDRWDAQLAASRTTPLLDEVNRLLRRRREPWSLRVAPEVSGRVAALDLDAVRARLPGLHGSRVVVVDANCSWLLEAEARHAQAPHAAAFAVLDQVADQLDLPEDRRAALLSEGARAALLESFPAGAKP